MSLTKRQKTLSAVFLIGLVALVVDRTVLRPQGGPRAASADSAVESPGVAPSPPPAGDPPARAPLAERLNRLLPGTEMGTDTRRDPFSLPASWSENGAANKERTPDTLGAFVQRHQLKAVVVQGGQPCALVDDSLVAPGESVDGFKLVSVNDRSVVFERDGKPAVLELRAP